MSNLEKQNQRILEGTAHLIKLKQALKQFEIKSAVKDNSEAKQERISKSLKECKDLIACIETELKQYTPEQIDAAVRQHKRD